MALRLEEAKREAALAEERTPSSYVQNLLDIHIEEIEEEKQIQKITPVIKKKKRAFKQKFKLKKGIIKHG